MRLVAAAIAVMLLGSIPAFFGDEEGPPHE